MPLSDLTEAEIAALVRLLRDTIAADRFVLSPHIRRLRTILSKLEPEPPAAQAQALLSAQAERAAERRAGEAAGAAVRTTKAEPRHFLPVCARVSEGKSGCKMGEYATDEHAARTTCRISGSQWRSRHVAE